MPAYELHDYSQIAVDTTLNGNINNVDTTIVITASTGWPTGGANGPFFAMIDYDVAGKELVLVTSRTGNTLQNVARNQGGTPGAGHTSGAKIRHVHTERDSHEANYAVSQTVGKVTTKGDLLGATAANTFGRLAVGSNNAVLLADSTQVTGLRWGTITQASLAADSVGASQIQTDAVGALELADNAVDTNAIANSAVTSAKIADGAIVPADLNSSVYGTIGDLTAIDIDDAAAVGSSPRLALADHQHAENVWLTGMIIMTGGPTADTGFLLCDGAAVSRTTFSGLFARIGTAYGTGDGSTTFNVPDLRQRFPLGKATSGTGATLGATGGTIDHVHGLDTSSSHARLDWTIDATLNDPVGQGKAGVTSWTGNAQGNTNMAAGSFAGRTGGVALGGNSDVANPPFQVVWFQIKT